MRIRKVCNPKLSPLNCLQKCVKKNLKKNIFTLVFYENYLMYVLRYTCALCYNGLMLNSLLFCLKYPYMLNFKILFSLSANCWNSEFKYHNLDENFFMIELVKLL